MLSSALSSPSWMSMTAVMRVRMETSFSGPLRKERARDLDKGENGSWE